MLKYKKKKLKSEHLHTSHRSRFERRMFKDLEEVAVVVTTLGHTRSVKSREGLTSTQKLNSAAACGMNQSVTAVELLTYENWI